jgi:hypothetical protein
MVAALALVAASYGPIAAQTTITSEPYATPNVYGCSLHYCWNELTVGQSFVAPNATDVWLTTFRLSLGHADGVPYTARLMEWNLPSGTAGRVLYEKAFASTPTTRQYVEFPVNQLLTYGGGMQYIFAVSLNANDGEVENHTALTVDGPLLAGSGYFIEKTGLTDLQTQSWTPHYAHLGFTAQFNSEPLSGTVPEPMSLLLVATGLLGVGAVARRRPERGEPRSDANE